MKVKRKGISKAQVNLRKHQRTTLNRVERRKTRIVRPADVDLTKIRGHRADVIIFDDYMFFD